MELSRRGTVFQEGSHVAAEGRHFRRHASLPSAWPGWATWSIAILALILVLLVALNWAEEENIIALLRTANPIWIVIGVLLQIGTYFSQAWCWRIGLAAHEQHLSLRNLIQLSVAQVFINQAVPSATVSGTLFVTKALNQKGIAEPVVAKTVAIEISSFVMAYGLALVLGLSVLAWKRHIGIIALVTALALISIIALVLSLLLFFVSHNAAKWSRLRNRFENFKAFDRIFQILQRLSGSTPEKSLIAKAVAPQLAVFFFDALTFWAMIRALGAHSDFESVFAAYMGAAIARTIGLLPGGLGAFEAVAIASLHQSGVPIGTSLAATLLYRALSFWFPMLPGFVFARREFHSDRRRIAARVEAFWTLPNEKALELLHSTSVGLSSDEADLRLVLSGPNKIREKESLTLVKVVWSQIKSPLVLLLFVASALAAITGEWADSAIISTILIISVGIGAWREYDAQSALEKLNLRLQHKADVFRDGKVISLPFSDLVPGDVVSLSAGSLVPADALVLESNDSYVNEASITGESFPVQKYAVPQGLPKESAPTRRWNSVFLGSHVQTGSAKCLVVNTGPATLFGALAEAAQATPPITDFDRGITSFGYMLLKIMTVIVLIVFAYHVVTTGVTVQVLMFSMALAVGLSPELLPLIVSYDLAYGAKLMSERGVLVRHTKAIENLGNMDILCTDKTGTLTEGVVKLENAFAPDGSPSPSVLHESFLNASLQAGLRNPLDDAIVNAYGKPPERIEKMGEVPYDFTRKRLSVMVRDGAGARVITKGALEKVLEVCRFNSDGSSLDETGREKIIERFRHWSEGGARVLGVAMKPVPLDSRPDRSVECDLRFAGFLVFSDTPKPGIDKTLNSLREAGVRLKVISGDNTLASQAIASKVGLKTKPVLEGDALDQIADEALPKAIQDVELFTQVDPNQKQRIVHALRKSGFTVGYLGDGINDVAAMHSADVSISVESAVDVAKSAANMVMLEKNLEMLKDGIILGRTTFVNSMKYITITMSANLGNMMSMAAASLFLPFLPLLPTQILLNNLLADIPALGLARDRVDNEQVQSPTRWEMKYILRFMIVFGALSSLFDFMTFGLLLKVYNLDVPAFRTGWFMESLLTELTVVMVIRTRRPFLQSKPGRLLFISASVLIAIAIALPYSPAARLFNFVPLNGGVVLGILGITLGYVFLIERAKRWPI